MEDDMATPDKSAISFDNPPTAYGYDDDGLFTQTELCSPDPLESKLKGNAVWLLPANATFVSPPAGVGKVAVWNGTAWELKEDNRGKEYWLPGDNWQADPRVMKDLGPLPDGTTFERPEPTEEEKFILLRGMRDGKIAATDYLIMPDYPLPEEKKAGVLAYRQALRDLPAQPGAPWDGGGEGTPWPELPDMLKKRQNVSTSGYTPGI